MPTVISAIRAGSLDATRRAKMPTWLRWVLVLPAALASYVGIQFLAGIQSETLPFPDRLQDLWSQGMNSILGPWAFVFLGARVAPRKVFETGVALSVIFGILTVAVAALALLNHGPPVRSPWWFGVSGVVGIVTVIATCFHLRTGEPSMVVSRVLGGLLFILSPVVIPLQIVTTFLLGILVSISFGLLLLPISLLWILLFAPLVAASWICSKAEFLRVPVGFLGIPWAVVANVFVCLMPSMGEMESRAAKMLLTETWPFSWEFWQFWSARLSIDDSPQFMRFHAVLLGTAEGDPIRQRVVERLARGEALDPDI